MKITANMVTLARIALLPIPCAFLLYGGMWAWWVALILFSLLGTTDFIDGMMARKEGPTCLGSLIDPVADKIFVAAVTLSYTSVGFFGSWFPILILSREFVLTSLRASVAFRGEQVKTGKLGKIKTVYQMGGFGTIFLSLALSGDIFIWLCAICGGAVFLIWAFLILRKKAPYWILPVALVLLLLAILRIFLSGSQTMVGQAIVIVGITWASGIDYLFSSFKIFKKSGFKRYDASRLFWALSCSMLLSAVVGFYPFLLIPILFFISFELGLGGVDAVVAAKENYVGSRPFLFSGVIAVMVFLFGYANYMGLVSLNVLAPVIVGAVLSGISFTIVFVKWRKLFKNVLE